MLVEEKKLRSSLLQFASDLRLVQEVYKSTFCCSGFTLTTLKKNFSSCIKMPKAKKKMQVPEDDGAVPGPMMELTKTDGPEDKVSLAPSCSSSLGSGSISKVEFLEAKVEWQDRVIKDLKQERNFLREQIMGGKKKSTQPKAITLEEDDEDDNMEEDNFRASSPNISESSDSDVVITRRKMRRTRSPASATVAVPGRGHVRVKGPDEVIRRYEKVLKSFSRVRTMSEAFRINGVDRGTIKMTAPIAELKIVDPETFKSLKFDPATETLLGFAKRCRTHITPEKKTVIEDMKSRGQLLPLLMKY